jgi:hypothetical protein
MESKALVLDSHFPSDVDDVRAQWELGVSPLGPHLAVEEVPWPLDQFERELRKRPPPAPASPFRGRRSESVVCHVRLLCMTLLAGADENEILANAGYYVMVERLRQAVLAAGPRVYISHPSWTSARARC